MKSIGRILAAVVMLVSFVVVGLVGVVCAKQGLFDERAQQAQADISDMQKLAQSSGALRKEYGAQIEAAANSGAKMKLYGYSGIAIVAFALGVVALSFAKRLRPLLVIAGLGAAFAVAFVSMFPSELRDASDMAKMAALFYALTAVSGVVFAKLAATTSAPSVSP